MTPVKGKMGRMSAFDIQEERYGNVSVWVRSLYLAGLAEQLEGTAPEVPPLPETPPAKAPPLRKWSP